MKKEVLQKMIDTAAPLMRKQGRCSHDKIRCLYRAKDGRKCFIGHLIADGAYSPDFEGLTPRDYVVLDALIKSGWDVHKDDAILLSVMQGRLHDNNIFPMVEGPFVKAFNEALKGFCKEHDLTYPEEA